MQVAAMATCILDLPLARLRTYRKMLLFFRAITISLQKEEALVYITALNQQVNPFIMDLPLACLRTYRKLLLFFRATAIPL